MDKKGWKSRFARNVQEERIRQFVTGGGPRRSESGGRKSSHGLSPAFVEGKTNHINDIESFWNQAKRHMRRFNGIPEDQFPLLLKECEWRFNYRPTENFFKGLLKWTRQDLL